MKICCISTSQVPSVTANSMQLMKACQALAQIGHEVELVVPSGGQPVVWEEMMSFYGLTTAFPVTWLKADPLFKRYDFCKNAVAYARRQKVDLIYTWALQSAIFALWYGTPVMLELHDMPSGKAGPLLFRLFLRARGPKRLLCITQALQQKLEKEYQVTFTPKQAAVTPNAVELERYQNLPDAPAARLELGLPEKLTAVYTGHFYAGRGLDILYHLAASFPQVNFIWAGGRASELEQVRQALAEKKLENVVLTGFIENRKLPLYQAAGDILLMPYETSIAGSSGGNSAEICSPMKMFEYLAAGRAILTSDLPVIREVLNENNARFLPPEDPDAWRDGFEELMNHPEIRLSLSAQAKADAVSYTWTARAEKALAGFNVGGKTR
jgi:glycosyltransferase involved in cell wall biosynthesis